MRTQGLLPGRIESVLGDRQRVIEALEQARWRSAETAFVAPGVHRIAELLLADLEGPLNALPRTEDAALIAFIEQWVIDASAMSEDLVAGVRDRVGADSLKDFVHSLLVIEQRIRLDLAWQKLGLLPEPPSPSPRIVGGEGAQGASPNRGSLSEALGEWQAAVVCLDSVDPTTTELVRLRCATHHDCHT